MSFNREYAVAMLCKDWDNIYAEMYNMFGTKWENLCSEADVIAENGQIALYWDNFLVEGEMVEKFIQMIHDLKKFYAIDIGDDPLQYGIDQYGVLETPLLDIERPKIVLPRSNLYPPEAEQIIRAMAKELPRKKAKAIFENNCYKRTKGIQMIFDSYVKPILGNKD